METLGIFQGHKIRLSSAGLIYAHYGKAIILSILIVQNPKRENIEILYKKLYECFVESIDAIDNGINQFDGEPRYFLCVSIGFRKEIKRTTLWRGFRA